MPLRDMSVALGSSALASSGVERATLASYLPVLKGRCFVHPAFDYLLIGGGLSLVVTAAVLSSSQGADFFYPASLPFLLLLSNSAHFASSTVRLYTKPGTYAAMPFLTMGFPLVALGVPSR